jgi:hypothetical protein
MFCSLTSHLELKILCFFWQVSESKQRCCPLTGNHNERRSINYFYRLMGSVLRAIPSLLPPALPIYRVHVTEKYIFILESFLAELELQCVNLLKPSGNFTYDQV